MASPNIWPQAFGPVGPLFATYQGGYFAGTVRFVDSIAGNDANTGLLPGLPKKTWSASVAAAGAGDVIILAPSFAETLTAAVTVGVANLATVGLGAGATKPTITTSFAGSAILLTAVNQRFFNVAFPAGGASGIKVASGSTGAIFEQCDFVAGTNDTQCIKMTSGAGIQIINCTFTATGGNGTNPANAILGTAGSTSVLVKSCTFDGGSGGWGGYAVDFTTIAPTGLDVRDCQLLNKSGFRIGITGATYSIFGLRPGDSTTCPIVITA